MSVSSVLDEVIRSEKIYARHVLDPLVAQRWQEVWGDTGVAPCLSFHLPIAFTSFRQAPLLWFCRCCCLSPLTLGPRLFSLQMRTDDKKLSRDHWGPRCYTEILRHSALWMFPSLSSWRQRLLDYPNVLLNPIQWVPLHIFILLIPFLQNPDSFWHEIFLNLSTWVLSNRV